MPKTLRRRPRAPHEDSRAPRAPRTSAPGSVWRTSGTALVAAAAALSLVLLGACGGGSDDDGARLATVNAAPTGDAGIVATTTAHAHAAGSSDVAFGSADAATRADGRREDPTADGAAPATVVDFRLESDYGPGDAPGPLTLAVAAPAERADPAATPVDRLARTRNGRYISRAVAERVDQETGGHVVWVDASCCAGLDPELPERIAFGMQAVLGDDAPLFVAGRDLRQAARLADRLHALGMRDVRLVTP